MVMPSKPLCEGDVFTEAHSKFYDKSDVLPIIIVYGTPRTKYTYHRMKNEEGTEILVWGESRPMFPKNKNVVVVETKPTLKQKLVNLLIRGR